MNEIDKQYLNQMSGLKQKPHKRTATSLQLQKDILQQPQSQQVLQQQISKMPSDDKTQNQSKLKRVQFVDDVIEEYGKQNTILVEEQQFKGNLKSMQPSKPPKPTSSQQSQQLSTKLQQQEPKNDDVSETSQMSTEKQFTQTQQFDQTLYLSTLKVNPRLDLPYKQLFVYYKQIKHQKIQQLQAITTLVQDVRQRYANQIKKLKTRLSQLANSDKSELNAKLIQQKLKQLGFVVFKVNCKTEVFVRSLVKAHNSSLDILKVNLAFKFMRFKANLRRIESGNLFQQKRLRVYFLAMVRQYNAFQQNEVVAEKRYKVFQFKILIAFMKVHCGISECEKLSETMDNLKTQDALFQTMKAKILRQLLQKYQLIGEVDQDKILNNTIPEQLEQIKINIKIMSSQISYYRKVLNCYFSKFQKVIIPTVSNQPRQKSSKCCCTCDEQDAASNFLGLKVTTCQGCSCGTCSCAISKDLCLSQPKNKQEDYHSLSLSKINIFKTPQIPIALEQRIEQPQSTLQISRYQYLKEKQFIDKSNKFFFMMKKGFFQVESLPEKFKQFLKKQPMAVMVDIEANLFLMAKAFHCYLLVCKREKFYEQCEQRGQRSFSLLYFEEFRKKVAEQKENESFIIFRRRNQKLMNKAFSVLKSAAKTACLPTEQKLSDNYFKIIIIRRQIRAWHVLVTQLKQKYDHLQQLIQTLKVITLLKPAFVNWFCLTQLVVETRERKQKLTSDIETRLQKYAFKEWFRKTALRYALFGVLNVATTKYVQQYSYYNSENFIKDIIQQWREQTSFQTSVSNISFVYQQKLVNKTFQQWRKQTQHEQLAESFQNEILKYRVHSCFYYWYQKLQSIYEKGNRIEKIEVKAFKFRQLRTLRFCYKMRCFLLNPILKQSIFIKWRKYVYNLQLCDIIYIKKLKKRAFDNIVLQFGYQKIETYLTARTNKCLLNKCFQSLLQYYDNKQLEFDQIMIEMETVADQFYFNKLVEWSSGRRGLCFPERLWSTDFALNCRYGGIEVLQKFQFLHKLVTEEKAWNAMLSFLKNRK